MQVVTANRLRDGAVVYCSATGWTIALADARLADGAEADALLAAAQAAPKPLPVVAPYLIEVAVTDGVPRPLSLRERIRAAGPTV